MKRFLHINRARHKPYHGWAVRPLDAVAPLLYPHQKAGIPAFKCLRLLLGKLEVVKVRIILEVIADAQ